MLSRLIGESQAWNQIMDQVSRVAALKRPVLIVGERGTGKELVAARVHYLSQRWEQEFLQMNCAAINESLLQSELFGHEAGAFTGANKRHVGRFERADQGTLFLDELATMSPSVQEQLLRVIEYGHFERVGGQQLIEVDVRLVAATNEDLPKLVKQHKFRADLLDRLAFDVITLPPLRARGDDVEHLAEHFALQMSVELELDQFAGLSDRAKDQLYAYHWPGNVRELKNVVERSLYLHDDQQLPLDQLIIDPFDSPYRPLEDAVEPARDAMQQTPRQHAVPGIEVVDLKAHLANEERRIVCDALASNRYNQKQTADALGISYHQLRAIIRKYPEVLVE